MAWRMHGTRSPSRPSADPDQDPYCVGEFDLLADGPAGHYSGGLHFSPGRVSESASALEAGRGHGASGCLKPDRARALACAPCLVHGGCGRRVGCNKAGRSAK